MINIAIPQIAEHFFLTIKQVEFLLNTYIFGALISFLLVGYLTNFFKKENIFRFSIAVFFFGIVICVFCKTISILVVGRLLQGIGFAGSFSMGLSLISYCFPENKVPLVLGITTMLSGIAQAIGPGMGTWIIYHLDWRYIFLFKLPFVFIAFLFSLSKLDVFYERNKVCWNWKLWICLVILLGVMHISPMCGNFFMRTSFLLILSLFLFYLVFLDVKRKNYFITPPEIHKLEYLTALFLRGMSMIYFSVLLFITSLYLQNILCLENKLLTIAFLTLTITYSFVSIFIYPRILKSSVNLKSCFCLQVIGLTLLIMYLTFLRFYLLILGLIFSGFSFGFSIPHSLNLVIASSKKLSQNAMGFFCCFSFFSSMLGVLLSGLLLELNSTCFLGRLSVEVIQGAQGIVKIDALSSPLFHQAKKVFEFSFSMLLWILILVTLLGYQSIWKLYRKERLSRFNR